jgi:hypothetical protein
VQLVISLDIIGHVVNVINRLIAALTFTDLNVVDYMDGTSVSYVFLRRLTHGTILAL